MLSCGSEAVVIGFVEVGEVGADDAVGVAVEEY